MLTWLKKIIIAIFEQVGSFINQTLTDQEKKKIPHSPINRMPLWKEKQKYPRH